MKAKFPGFCPRCKQRFKVGIDEIGKDNTDGKWKHVSCSTAGQYKAKQSQLVGKQYATNVNIPLSIDTNPIISNDDLDAFTAAIESIDEIEAHADRNEFKSFIPSHFQQDIFDFIANESGHAVIEAVAGSGKTTTIVKALELTPKDAKVAFIAFNKHIAKELSDRCNAMGLDQVHVSTMHSLGMSVIRKISPKIEVDKYGDKIAAMLDEIWPVSKQAVKDGLVTEKQKKINYIKRFAIRKLVSICKSTLTDENNPVAIAEMIERYSVEVDLEFLDEIVNELPRVIQGCKENYSLIDFDDMPWLPVVLNIQPDQFDYLFIDEAQDLSVGNIEFLLRCVKPTGRIIAVGDRFQSLYAFRGADSEAIPNLINRLHATVLPLSVTYRCPVSHIELAQEIVPEIFPRDNAPIGEVRSIDIKDLANELVTASKEEELKETKQSILVVCRTNAQLVKPAFECIRRGQKAMIRGLEVGSSLIQLIKRFETNDLGQFEISLNEYFEKEYTRFMDKGKEMQAVLLQDKVQTLVFIMNECNTVAELMGKINMLFSDNNTGVVFSSVHRAKGLESNKVYILRPDLMPHPKAKKDKPWQMQQEMNTKYVAITRSKDQLIFVTGE